MVYLDPDTAMNEHSLAAARNAAGAVVLGTDLVMSGRCDNAFCAVRPPVSAGSSGSPVIP